MALIDVALVLGQQVLLVEPRVQVLNDTGIGVSLFEGGGRVASSLPTSWIVTVERRPLHEGSG